MCLLWKGSSGQEAPGWFYQRVMSFVSAAIRDHWEEGQCLRDTEYTSICWFWQACLKNRDIDARPCIMNFVNSDGRWSLFPTNTLFWIFQINTRLPVSGLCTGKPRIVSPRRTCIMPIPLCRLPLPDLGLNKYFRVKRKWHRILLLVEHLTVNRQKYKAVWF
jgi:hypothetical protein